VTPRLTIFLGAGGVGKTTLAGALGLAMAGSGGRAALLSVDPARRLRSALALGEDLAHGVPVRIANGGGALDAALLDPSACLRRWVTEASPDPDTSARLSTNPYFLALADRVAGLSDAIGSVRAIEWAEHDSALTDFVLDTAPGLPAVELLTRPEKLLAFFDGRLVRWLVHLARFGAIGHGGHLLSGLSHVSGADGLRAAGDFLSLVEGAVETMKRRLAHARDWLGDPRTSLVIVCGVSDDSVAVAEALDRAVRAIGLQTRLVVLNRTLPAALGNWSPHIGADSLPPTFPFVRYVGNYLGAQAQVRTRLDAQFPRVVEVPDSDALDTASRQGSLAALGEPLRMALPTQATRSAGGRPR
jgi:anion-transporting  ArsA/GET3 family ATPase